MGLIALTGMTLTTSNAILKIIRKKFLRYNHLTRREFSVQVHNWSTVRADNLRLLNVFLAECWSGCKEDCPHIFRHPCYSRWSVRRTSTTELVPLHSSIHFKTEHNFSFVSIGDSSSSVLKTVFLGLITELKSFHLISPQRKPWALYFLLATIY